MTDEKKKSERCRPLDESLVQIAIVKKQVQEKLMELDKLLCRAHLDYQSQDVMVGYVNFVN
jgi:hypothetical protein